MNAPPRPTPKPAARAAAPSVVVRLAQPQAEPLQMQCMPVRAPAARAGNTAPQSRGPPLGPARMPSMPEPGAGPAALWLAIARARCGHVGVPHNVHVYQFTYMCGWTWGALSGPRSVKTASHSSTNCMFNLPSSMTFRLSASIQPGTATHEGSAGQALTASCGARWRRRRPHRPLRTSGRTRARSWTTARMRPPRPPALAWLPLAARCGCASHPWRLLAPTRQHAHDPQPCNPGSSEVLASSGKDLTPAIIVKTTGFLFFTCGGR